MVNPPVIVALAGRRGVGKDTAADMLVAHFGFRKTMFAGLLKELAEKLFSLTHDELYGPSHYRERPIAEAVAPDFWPAVLARVDWHADALCAPFAGAPEPIARSVILARLHSVLADLRALGGALTPRAILQQLGTEWGRALWREVWTRAPLDAALRGELGGRVVFTDTRFPREEGLGARAAGGEVWWIERPGLAPANDNASAHSSEPAFRDFVGIATDVLVNDSDRESLRWCVTRLAVRACAIREPYPTVFARGA